ncbi:glycerol kinase GlpK, partial [Candidatus Sumerlaeota bacterium]|nr:glycerol kinase GlpK [Candidatus Sumerlaeota bacterium]
ARARAENGELAFGTVDSWLLYKLTGGRVFATDASNASRTLLYNIHSLQWDDELLTLFGVPRALLPEARPSSEIYGETDKGLPIPGVPIAGVAGDQQAALFGQMCIQPGMAKNTYGTGCFMLMNAGDSPVVSSNHLLSTVGWILGGKTSYALEGSVFAAGAVVQWLRDGLGLIQHAPEIEILASSVPDNGGVAFVPAFTGLGAPHWDPHARGTICGISRGTRAGNIARAALEAIGFQVADLYDAMRADSGMSIPELRVDGGAAANNLLMQIQADLLQMPLVRPEMTEITALGAALFAGLAVGFWKDLDELASIWRVERRFEPQMPPSQAAALRSHWAEAVLRSKNWGSASK